MSDLEDAIEDLGTDDFLVPHDLNDRYDSWLKVTEAARLLASPTDEDLERLYPPLLNFRKWVRKTNALTDHDLLVTARRMITALENK